MRCGGRLPLPGGCGSGRGEYGPDLGQIMVSFQYPGKGLILGEIVEMHVSFVSIPVPVTGEQGTVQSYEL